MSRHNYLKRTYAMSANEYDAQLAFQNYVCAACQSENPVGRDGVTRENLSVDHNHATGENRALLCQRCNKILGLAKDHPEVLLFLVEYLRQHGGDPTPYLPDNPETRAAQEAALAAKERAWEESLKELPASEASAVEGIKVSSHSEQVQPSEFD